MEDEMNDLAIADLDCIEKIYELLEVAYKITGAGAAFHDPDENNDHFPKGVDFSRNLVRKIAGMELEGLDFCNDAVERNQVKVALLLSRFSMDRAGISIYHTDENGAIFSVNDYACTSLGYSKDELCALSIFDIDPAITREKIYEINRMLDASGSATYETIHQRRDGTTFPVEITANLLQFHGKTFGISFVKDITERKRAEESLRESKAWLKQKDMLEESISALDKKVQEEVAMNRGKDIILIQQNRMAALGEMFEHIAHQWKQPLNSIAIIIQALGSVSAHEQVTGEYILGTVDSLMEMVGHMAQTVDDFRNFYKPDKEKSVFLVQDFIGKALYFVMPVFRHYGIEVNLDADPELSAFGYPKEYAQVLLNILGNAKDAFMERGTENPRINIKALADGDNAVVTITDNAGGIPEESVGRIFDLYFTTKESSGGTGIGLYMSKNIIEKNMGGKLTVSNIDNGARFRIELGRS
jgi:PAS domain S-box-containing protein